MKQLHGDPFLPNLTFTDDWWVFDALKKTKQKDAKIRRAEKHAKSCHFLIDMSVPKFPKIALEPPEYPKIGKHLIYEHLWAFSPKTCWLKAKS